MYGGPRWALNPEFSIRVNLTLSSANLLPPLISITSTALPSAALRPQIDMAPLRIRPTRHSLALRNARCLLKETDTACLQMAKHRVHACFDTCRHTSISIAASTPIFGSTYQP